MTKSLTEEYLKMLPRDGQPTAKMVTAGVKEFKKACGGYASLSEKIMRVYWAMEKVKGG